QPRSGRQPSPPPRAAAKRSPRWLAGARRAADNPLAHLEGGNVRLDRRHERRELSDAELARLFRAAAGGGRVRRVDGPDREVRYLVSVYTGLLAAAAASLGPAAFAPHAAPPA